MNTKIAFPLLLLLAGVQAMAVNHIVTFGSSLRYSPDSLTVNVGDTVTWQGAFGTHPLESTSVPSGASVFGTGSGTTFSYPVTVAGEYTYHCAIHFSLGMVGQFTAVNQSTGIGQVASANVRVFPLLTDDVVNVSLSGYSSNPLRAEVINAGGSLLATVSALADGITPVSLGTYSKGIYFLLIRDDDDIISVTKVMKQ